MSSFLLAAPGRTQPPNVLIVIADDLGVDKVGAYQEGPAPPPTPNIDALASRGVLFRNAWASPVCSPARACIHTGRHALRTLVGTAITVNPPPENVLQLSELTLPELLDRAGSGYAHALIGKWHLGDSRNGGPSGPNLAGWSYYAGFLDGQVFGEQTYFGWPRTVNGQSSFWQAYITTQIVDDALAWIGSVREPWVCMVSFTAPHRPFHAPPSSLHSQTLPNVAPNRDPVPFYTAMVEAMDTEIGRLLGSLGPALANTNVLFIADNGTPRQVTEPPFAREKAKGTVYEPGVNVPLIVAGPAVVGDPRENIELVSAVDLFATVAELCGVTVSREIGPLDSVSFVPYLSHPGHASLRSTVFTEEFDGSIPNANGQAAIRDARYKLIRRYPQPGPEELYDLLRDPFEISNLIGGPLTREQRAAYHRLAAELEKLRPNE